MDDRSELRKTMKIGYCLSDSLVFNLLVCLTYSLTVVSNHTFSYSLLFQNSKNAINDKKSESALSPELYAEYILCKNGRYDHAIACALKERRFQDAKALRNQKAKSEYTTSEVLTDEIKLRFENLVTQLANRFEQLADNGDIEGCEICYNHQGIITKILDLNAVSTSSVIASSVSAVILAEGVADQPELTKSVILTERVADQPDLTEASG